MGELESVPERLNGNYVSAKFFEDQILELFREEEKLGWMSEVTEADAKRIYGDPLRVAALGGSRRRTRYVWCMMARTGPDKS